MAHNVRALLVELFGDSVATDDTTSDVTIGTVAVQLLTYNPRRVRAILTNLGGAPVVIGRDFAVTATTGIQIAPGESLEFDWQEDLEDVTRQWVGISAAAGNSVHVHEVILNGTVDASSDL